MVIIARAGCAQMVRNHVQTVLCVYAVQRVGPATETWRDRAACAIPARPRTLAWARNSLRANAEHVILDTSVWLAVHANRAPLVSSLMTQTILQRATSVQVGSTTRTLEQHAPIANPAKSPTKISPRVKSVHQWRRLAQRGLVNRVRKVQFQNQTHRSARFV